MRAGVDFDIMAASTWGHKYVSLARVWAYHVRIPCFERGFANRTRKTSVPVSSPGGHGRQGVLFGRR